MTISQRVIQVLIAFDQLINTVIGLLLGDGWADETLSAKSYRLRHDKWWGIAYKLINRMFFWQNNHCKVAYISELKARHLSPEYRKLMRDIRLFKIKT